MPFLRSWEVAYETSTADGGLIIPMSEVAVGDLMIAYVASDTGVPVWSALAAGWAQLYANTTTAMFWKKATSIAEANFSVTGSVLETYSGFLTVWGDAYADAAPVFSQTTATGVRVAMPQPATARNNSILLYAMASTGNNAGMFGVESDMNSLAISDGSAEGVGSAWALEKVATATSTLRYMIAPVSVSHKASVVIAAPIAGATVIPNHIISEPCVLLDPNISTVAFDGNTIIANTADTDFGTSIAGKTCNDATVAVTADIGLDVNSYHGMMGITHTASQTTMSGADITLAASRYNVGNSNILTCVRKATANAVQMMSTIASGRGVWMGIRSGATAAANWKTWQIYAKDVAQDFGNPIPVIINPTNTDTNAINGTLVSTDIRKIGMWSGGAVAGKVCFGLFWKMGTTVVSSGTNIMTMPALMQLIATDKERLSIIRQGANQYLMYQLVQLGDGTNPMNFQIDGVAIEFPSKRNAAAGLINFNGADNSLGFIFYPQATTGVIKMTNCSLVSASLQAFQVHASAPSSATWDFRGTKLSGFGDIQLRAVWTWTEMIFDNCKTITQNSAVIDNVAFTASSKIISATLSDMDNISNCSFASSGTGHAIEVSGAAGTISLSGNQFTGYAASNGSTGNEAIFVNIATGTVTINIAGGGSTPSIRTAGATVNVVSGATVTFTGFPTGTDIVILTAGTSTILAQVDAHPSTSYAYSYAGTPTIDIGFIKAGMVPFYIRSLALGTTDSSIPVSLTTDRNYA